MDEKELNKKLRSDVKPGTESLAINEAQTQANQLLTEQRMNLESERQMAQSSSVRDIELRGAIELGAMNQPQVQQVALPPQAAGLRPETQQLLANYGVNPTITESSRRSSNSSQSRTSNTTSKVDPNGGTRVTNTTNITNITNNDNRTETDIDIDQPVQSTQPTVMPAVSQQSDTSKFKIFMSNLFAKRDQEARIQEREFRKRDWSIKRMTDKVIQRMDKISTSFAKRMNPENVGKTIGSQLKVILTALGFAVLPKIFPSIKSAFTTVGSLLSDGFSYLKSVFSDSSDGKGFLGKLGTIVKDALWKGAGFVTGAFSNAIEALGNKLGKLLLGDNEYEGGLVSALEVKLKEWIGGAESAGKNLVDVISDKFKEIGSDLKNYLQLLMEDRAQAVKQAYDKSDFSVWDIKESLGGLAKILGAAIGGTKFLAYSELSSKKSEANEIVTKGTEGKSLKDSSRIIVSNMSKDAKDLTKTSAFEINEGVKELYELSKKSESDGLHMNFDDIKSILLKTTKGQQEYSNALKSLESARNVGLIDVVSNGIYSSADYHVKKQFVPEFLSILLGRKPSIISESELKFSYLSDEENSKGNFDAYSKYLDKVLNDSDSNIELLRSIDLNALPKTHGDVDPSAILSNIVTAGGVLFDPELWRNEKKLSDAEWEAIYKKSESQLKSYNEYKSQADENEGKRDEALNRLGESTGVNKVVRKTREWSNNVSNELKEGKEDFSEYKARGYNYAREYTGYGDEVQFNSGDVTSKSSSQSIDNTNGATNNVSKIDSLSLNERRSAILGWLMSEAGLNLSKDQALGVLAVMEAESNLNPQARNTMASGNYPDNGLCQWQGKYRNDMFRDWYKSTHPEDTENAKKSILLPNMFDASVQLEFLKYDLTKNRPRSYQSILDSESSVESLDAFLRGYENGGNGLASPDSINKTYNKQSSWWAKNTKRTGVQPYDQMFRDRVKKLELITGQNLNPSELSQLSKMKGTGVPSSIGSFSTSDDSSSGGIFSVFSGAVDTLLGIFSGSKEEDTPVITDTSNESSSLSSIPEISSKMVTAEMDDSVSVSSSSSVPTFSDGGISQQAKSIQEYIENKDDELVKDEKLPSEVPPIIVGGDTHVGGSSTVTNNTTVVNVNDSFESFIDTKSRSNRRN